MHQNKGQSASNTYTGRIQRNILNIIKLSLEDANGEVLKIC